MQIFLVGGAVRDRLLSLSVHERDWVVVGSTPEAMLSQDYRQVGKDFPVFIHPDTGEEYALARTERKSGKGHQGFNVFSSPSITLEEDLLRRDLTINAIAEDEHGNLTDPYGGQKDLQNRILRHISPAFSEDPLRVLRVARFAARFWDLGFSIDPTTLALMSAISSSDELEQLSKERIWQETKRALETAHPEIYILILSQIGALNKIAPPLAHVLQGKEALLRLPHLRDITHLDFRYVGLVMIASLQNGCLDLEIAKQMNSAFACPTSLQKLTALTVNHFTTCHDALSLTSNNIYQILHRLDAFRRQQRCLHILKCMQELNSLLNTEPSASLDFLLSIVPRLNSIRLDLHEQQKLDGKAIGDALIMLRQQAIDKEKQAHAVL